MGETERIILDRGSSSDGRASDAATERSLSTHTWLSYWCAYGCFNLAEILSDRILWWLPYYYTIKLCVLLFLVLPTSKLSRCLYLNLLRPLFIKNHLVVDPYVVKAEQQVESCLGEAVEHAEHGA